MTKQNSDAIEDGPVSAAVESKSGFSVIWVIPFVALLIGVWLAYKAISEQGPTVTIAFRSAEGLEGGKTRVKYKAVDVGKVESVAISEDLSDIIVTASLDKNIGSHLNTGTRFWVVRPRLGASGVSGLDTLVSGAYLEIDPGDGEPTTAFRGLEEPPVLKRDAPGNIYVLETEELGSLQPGSAVYYRQIKVGEVLGHEFSQSADSVLVHVFVEAPYHTLVRTNSRFWNASGVDVSVDSSGVSVKTESLQALLSGGIAFDSPAGESEPSESGARFNLSANHSSLHHQQYTEKIPYVVYFDSSLRGLSIGAPVEFQGIQVGSVTNIRLEYDNPSMNILTPVYVELEPQRVTPVRDVPAANAEEVIDLLIERGLRAQLRTASLITGQQYIEVELHPGTRPGLSGLQSDYPELPTIPSTIDAFTDSASGLLAEVRALPLEELMNELISAVQKVSAIADTANLDALSQQAIATLRTVDSAAKSLSQQITPLSGNFQTAASSAVSALDGAQQALAALEQGSPLRRDLHKTLDDISSAAKAVRTLAQLLERNPDSLLYGKGTRR